MKLRLPRLESDHVLLLLAAAIGATGALADAGFRGAIGLVHRLLAVPGITTRAEGYLVAIVLLPALGGVAVAVLGRATGRDVFGYGMPRFLEAVNLRDGALSLRDVLARTFAAVITLGTGGSAGVEGPVAVLGGGVGAAAARASRLVGERVKLLIACGSSAAIASAYGAPITGVFFTQEIVLAGNYDLRNFVRVVVASAASTVVARAIRGDAPLFSVQPFRLRTGAALIAYLAVGIACGLIGPFFARTLARATDTFRASRIPKFWRPALGGLLVGLIALVYPAVLGDGAPYVQRMLQLDLYPGGRVLVLLLGLVLAKTVATSLTLGSGGAGGVFGPSVFLGAVVGSFVGAVALRITPDLVGPPYQFALVGIGALLAATTRAPLTSIFLVFELTASSSTVVLPALLAVAAAIFVASRFEAASIDEMELHRKGIRLSGGREINALRELRVAGAMSATVPLVPASMPAPELYELMKSSTRNAYVVVDPKNEMLGILSLSDLRALTSDMAKDLGALAVAGDVAQSGVLVTYPDESLADALEKLDRKGFRQLPVVARDNPVVVVGMLERRHVITAYRRALAGVGTTETTLTSK